MKVKFWGVRGSIPSPLSPLHYKEKIYRILELSLENKLESKCDINEFIESLPDQYKTTFGGNTSCVTVSSGNTTIILDAGSGLKDFGNSIYSEGSLDNKHNLNILLSHTHLDHINGLPFFGPLYDSNVSIYFYSVHKDIAEPLKNQQSNRFFPVPFEKTGSKKSFINKKEGEEFNIGSFKVTSLLLDHPNGSYAYRIEDKNGKILVYATDGEYKPGFNESRVCSFYKDADVLIFDAQYTMLDLSVKYDYGHSTPVMGVDLARKSRVKKLILFHHDPFYNDQNLKEANNAAVQYEKMQYGDNQLEIITANEGMVIDIN